MQAYLVGFSSKEDYANFETLATVLNARNVILCSPAARDQEEAGR